MIQTPYTPPPKNRWMIPLILSVMVHGILVAVLWFWRPSPPVFIDHGIQTNLITSGDIAEIEGQIRENARLASQAQDGQDSQESSSQAQLSPHMQAYNDELAQKEAEFQAQIAKFAQELDAETLADMQALDAELAQKRHNSDLIGVDATGFADFKVQILAITWHNRQACQAKGGQ